MDLSLGEDLGDFIYTKIENLVNSEFTLNGSYILSAFRRVCPNTASHPRITSQPWLPILMNVQNSSLEVSNAVSCIFHVSH